MWLRPFVRSCGMILIDTGPLVALFDPQDGQHNRCRRVLKEIRDAILTTTPVLTEAFHMLGPASIGSDRLSGFVEDGGLSEALGTRRVFSIDRKDFETYRVRRGHRHYPVEIVS